MANKRQRPSTGRPIGAARPERQGSRISANGQKPHYHKEYTSAVYIPLEDLDFYWDQHDVLLVDQLWNGGHSIRAIAERFQRDPDEILILLLDRARKGRIKARPGGLFGGMDE